MSCNILGPSLEDISEEEEDDEMADFIVYEEEEDDKIPGRYNLHDLSLVL